MIELSRASLLADGMPTTIEGAERQLSSFGPSSSSKDGTPSRDLPARLCVNLLAEHTSEDVFAFTDIATRHSSSLLELPYDFVATTRCAAHVEVSDVLPSLIRGSSSSVCTNSTGHDRNGAVHDTATQHQVTPASKPSLATLLRDADQFARRADQQQRGQLVEHQQSRKKRELSPKTSSRGRPSSVNGRRLGSVAPVVDLQPRVPPLSGSSPRTGSIRTARTASTHGSGQPTSSSSKASMPVLSIPRPQTPISTKSAGVRRNPSLPPRSMRPIGASWATGQGALLALEEAKARRESGRARFETRERTKSPSISHYIPLSRTSSCASIASNHEGGVRRGDSWIVGGMDDNTARDFTASALSPEETTEPQPLTPGATLWLAPQDNAKGLCIEIHASTHPDLKITDIPRFSKAKNYLDHFCRAPESASTEAPNADNLTTVTLLRQVGPQHVVVGFSDGTVHLYNAVTLEMEAEMRAHEGAVWCATSPACIGTSSLWEPEHMLGTAHKASRNAQEDPVDYTNIFLSGGDDSAIVLWNLKNLSKSVKVAHQHNGAAVSSLVLDVRRQLVVSGGADGSLRMAALRNTLHMGENIGAKSNKCHSQPVAEELDCSAQRNALDTTTAAAHEDSLTPLKSPRRCGLLTAIHANRARVPSLALPTPTPTRQAQRGGSMKSTSAVAPCSGSARRTDIGRQHSFRRPETSRSREKSAEMETGLDHSSSSLYREGSAVRHTASVVRPPESLRSASLKPLTSKKSIRKKPASRSESPAIAAPVAAASAGPTRVSRIGAKRVSKQGDAIAPAREQKKLSVSGKRDSATALQPKPMKNPPSPDAASSQGKPVAKKKKKKLKKKKTKKSAESIEVGENGEEVAVYLFNAVSRPSDSDISSSESDSFTEAAAVAPIPHKMGDVACARRVDDAHAGKMDSRANGAEDFELGPHWYRAHAHDNAVTAIVITCEDTVLTGGVDGTVRLCALLSGVHLRVIDLVAAPVTSLVLDDVNQILWAGHADGAVSQYKWRRMSNVKVGDLPGSDGSAACVVPLQRRKLDRLVLHHNPQQKPSVEPGDQIASSHITHVAAYDYSVLCDSRHAMGEPTVEEHTALAAIKRMRGDMLHTFRALDAIQKAVDGCLPKANSGKMEDDEDGDALAKFSIFSRADRHSVAQRVCTALTVEWAAGVLQSVFLRWQRFTERRVELRHESCSRAVGALAQRSQDRVRGIYLSHWIAHVWNRRLAKHAALVASAEARTEPHPTPHQEAPAMLTWRRPAPPANVDTNYGSDNSEEDLPRPQPFFLPQRRHHASLESESEDSQVMDSVDTDGYENGRESQCVPIGGTMSSRTMQQLQSARCLSEVMQCFDYSTTIRLRYFQLWCHYSRSARRQRRAHLSHEAFLLTTELSLPFSGQRLGMVLHNVQRDASTEDEIWKVSRRGGAKSDVERGIRAHGALCVLVAQSSLKIKAQEKQIRARYWKKWIHWMKAGGGTSASHERSIAHTSYHASRSVLQTYFRRWMTYTVHVMPTARFCAEANTLQRERELLRDLANDSRTLESIQNEQAGVAESVTLTIDGNFGLENDVEQATNALYAARFDHNLQLFAGLDRDDAGFMSFQATACARESSRDVSRIARACILLRALKSLTPIIASSGCSISRLEEEEQRTWPLLQRVHALRNSRAPPLEGPTVKSSSTGQRTSSHSSPVVSVKYASPMLRSKRHTPLLNASDERAARVPPLRNHFDTIDEDEGDGNSPMGGSTRGAALTPLRLPHSSNGGGWGGGGDSMKSAGSSPSKDEYSSLNSTCGSAVANDWSSLSTGRTRRSQTTINCSSLSEFFEAVAGRLHIQLQTAEAEAVLHLEHGTGNSPMHASSVERTRLSSTSRWRQEPSSMNSTLRGGNRRVLNNSGAGQSNPLLDDSQSAWIRAIAPSTRKSIVETIHTLILLYDSFIARSDMPVETQGTVSTRGQRIIVPLPLTDLCSVSAANKLLDATAVLVEIVKPGFWNTQQKLLALTVEVSDALEHGTQPDKYAAYASVRGDASLAHVDGGWTEPRASRRSASASTPRVTVGGALGGTVSSRSMLFPSRNIHTPTGTSSVRPNSRGSSVPRLPISKPSNSAHETIRSLQGSRAAGSTYSASRGPSVGGDCEAHGSPEGSEDLEEDCAGSFAYSAGSTPRSAHWSAAAGDRLTPTMSTRSNTQVTYAYGTARPYLGFRVQVLGGPSRVGRSSTLVIQELAPTFANIEGESQVGPALAAGLEEGDRLVRFAGYAVTDLSAFNAIVARHVRIGASVSIIVKRGDSTVTCNITTGCKREQRPGTPSM